MFTELLVLSFSVRRPFPHSADILTPEIKLWVGFAWGLTFVLVE